MAVILRRARPSDRKEVLRVCRTTWGGGDYIPRYFNEWVRGKGFYLAVDGRRVVGIAKYTELCPEELWLEGLRVDPERRGRGLGWKISKFILKQALSERPISLRLATGRRNTHSRRIIRKMGLKHEISFWGRDGRIPSGPSPLSPLPMGEAKEDCVLPHVFIPNPLAAFEYIRRTEEYKASKHLLQHTWQFRTITPELMAELAKLKRIFAYGSNDNIRGLLIIQPGRYESGRLEISFIEGDRKALAEFREQVRSFARENQAKVVKAKGPSQPRPQPQPLSLSGMARGRSMLRHLGGLGMRPWRRPGKLPWVLVYEYPLDPRKSSAH